MVFGHTEFDHELVIDSTTRRLSLLRENGKAIYENFSLKQQYRDPLRIIQSSWINGHGQYYVSPFDMYFEGQSIDTFQDGKVALGPLICEVQEDDDTALDSAVLGFKWFEYTGEWLCWTSTYIYRYVADDTGIDTGAEINATATSVLCDADATTPIPVNSIIKIDSEYMWVTATGTTLTMTRGFGGSTAATHVTNSDIYIYKWKKATTDLSGVTGMCEFSKVMYAARGASTTYSTSADGITWTATDLADNKAVGFLVTPNPDGTAENIWKFKTPNELSRTTNGAAGGVAWETPTYVGDTSHNIINIFLQNNKLMIGKEDNLFFLDSNGGCHPYRDDLKTSQSVNNYKYVTEWQTSVYHSEGKGMAEITAYNSYDVMGPLTGIDDIGKAGQVIGLAGDKDFLYVGYDEGTNSIIYKCREVVDKYGKLRWQRCPWIFLGTNACSTIAVCQHSSTDIRLWFGYGTKTGFVVLSENPLSDSNARFCASGSLRMSYDYGTNPNWDMLIQSIVTQTTGAAANVTWQIKYRKDTDSSATACTAALTTNGTIETNLTASLAGKRFCFEIHLASNNPTTTPQVLYFEAKGIEKPEPVRYHKCVYRIASDQDDTAKTLRNFLRSGRSFTGLIKFADMRYGDSTSSTSYVWVVMEPDYPREVEIWHEKEQYPELGIECLFREVSYTIN